MTDKMTGAELKTMRESLGLTAQWLANQSNVRLRTVQYWESGRMSVPDDVSLKLKNIEKIVDETVKDSINFIEELIKNKLIEKAVLIRYKNDEELWRFRPDMHPLTSTTHAIILYKVMREFLSREIPATIEFMNKDEYLKWLNGRHDSESARAAWISMKQTG